VGTWWQSICGATGATAPAGGAVKRAIDAPSADDEDVGSMLHLLNAEEVK